MLHYIFPPMLNSGDVYFKLSRISFPIRYFSSGPPEQQRLIFRPVAPSRFSAPAFASKPAPIVSSVPHKDRRYIGVVVLVRPEKRFGFIKCDELSLQIFMNYRCAVFIVVVRFSYVWFADCSCLFRKIIIFPIFFFATYLQSTRSLF